MEVEHREGVVAGPQDLPVHTDKRISDTRNLSQCRLQELGHLFIIGKDVERLQHDEELAEDFAARAGSGHLHLGAGACGHVGEEHFRFDVVRIPEHLPTHDHHRVHV